MIALLEDKLCCFQNITLTQHDNKQPNMGIEMQGLWVWSTGSCMSVMHACGTCMCIMHARGTCMSVIVQVTMHAGKSAGLVWDSTDRKLFCFLENVTRFAN